MSMTAGSCQIINSGSAFTASGSGMALVLANALISAGLYAPAGPSANFSGEFWSQICNGLATGIVSYLESNAVVTLPATSVDGTHPVSPVLQGIT
jgi:hypothetical protein